METSKSHLNIVIVGAGLAGLSSAIALTRAGHKVLVLESKSGLSEVGAGVQIQPNATRILYSWNLREQIEQAADPAIAVLIRRYDTGEKLKLLQFRKGLTELPTWLFYRPDFQKLLYDNATALGAEVRFNAKVVDIRPDGPTVQCDDGSRAEADLILVADGIGSKNRKFAIHSEDVKPIVLNRAYRLLIPRDTMLQHAETSALMTAEHRQLWLGPHRNVVSYSVSRGKFYNVVLEQPGEAVAGEWNRPGDLQTMKEEYKLFEPAVQKIMELADSCMDWALARLPPLPRWHDDSGRILLIGDAAHATTPQTAQGAGMAIEDAAVLAECLAFLSSKSDIISATSAFVTLRKNRVKEVQEASADNFRLFTLPDGPEQEARDRKWREGDAPSENGTTGKSVQLTPLFDRFGGYDAIAEAQAFLMKNAGNGLKI